MTQGSKGEKREYPGFIQKHEKRFLLKLAEHVPSFITSDHFTLLAFFSSVGIFFCYLYGPKYHYLYLISIVLWFLHYISDSLDGTLARFRHQERPRYGYYIDHILDSISVFFMLSGLAFSGITNPFIWLLTTIFVLIIFNSGFLKVYVENKFVVGLRFLRIGSTEARIAMMVFSLILFIFVNSPSLQKISITLFSMRFNLIDILGIGALIAVIFSLSIDILLTANRLNREDSKLLSRK